MALTTSGLTPYARLSAPSPPSQPLRGNPPTQSATVCQLDHWTIWSLHIVYMKTLTVTEARKNLSSWLRRAKAGEDIGIIDGNRIIALRPVEVISADRVEVQEIAVPAATRTKMNAVASAWKKRKAQGLSAK